MLNESAKNWWGPAHSAWLVWTKCFRINQSHDIPSRSLKYLVRAMVLIEISTPCDVIYLFLLIWKKSLVKTLNFLCCFLNKNLQKTVKMSIYLIFTRPRFWRKNILMGIQITITITNHSNVPNF